MGGAANNEKAQHIINTTQETHELLLLLLLLQGHSLVNINFEGPMASFVLYNPSCLLLNQAAACPIASVARNQSSQSLNLAFDLKARTNGYAFQDKCTLHSFGTSQPSSRFPVAMTASEQATPETVGGVTEVEDEESLERFIQEAGDKLVVLDISTTTCGPCKLIYPKIVKMSKEYPDAVFLKINGDLNSGTRALMRKWGVRAVPNFRFYLNGKLVHSHTGANEDELRANFLTHYMAAVQV